MQIMLLHMNGVDVKKWISQRAKRLSSTEFFNKMMNWEWKLDKNFLNILFFFFHLQVYLGVEKIEISIFLYPYITYIFFSTPRYIQ